MTISLTISPPIPARVRFRPMAPVRRSSIGMAIGPIIVAMANEIGLLAPGGPVAVLMIAMVARGGGTTIPGENMIRQEALGFGVQSIDMTITLTSTEDRLGRQVRVAGGA